MLNSIPVLLHTYVPMSLLNLESLHQVLDQDEHLQSYATDHPTLAIPLESILSYHAPQPLQDVPPLPEGLLLTLSMLLASRTSVMIMYEAIPLPLSQPDNASASNWDPEAHFFAVSEGRDSALVTEAYLANCIGSAQYSICDPGLATESLWSSCLSTIFLETLFRHWRYANLYLTFYLLRNKSSIWSLAFGSSFLPPLISNFGNVMQSQIRLLLLLLTQEVEYVFSP